MTTLTPLSPPSHPHSVQLQQAIRDLVKSGSSRAGRETKLQIASDELLKLPFYTDEGRLRVIKLLTTLRGYHVMKIIRQGLQNVATAYKTPKEFEEESVKLVELCSRQYLKNAAKGKATPSSIVDWGVELCKEFAKATDNPPRYSLSKLLELFIELYEAMSQFNTLLPSKETQYETFKTCLDVIKPRIFGDGFDELIAETINIVVTDGKLQFLSDPCRLIGIQQTTAMLLLSWVDLLRVTFVTNDFAVSTARHDAVMVRREEYSTNVNVPFAGWLSYLDSLVFVINVWIQKIAKREDQACILPRDSERLKIFFDNSESVVRYPEFCLTILGSVESITNQVMEEVFTIMDMKMAQSTLLKAFFLPLQSCQDVSFMTIYQSLFSLQDKQQILSILKFWKNRYPEDSKYVVLSEISFMITAIIDKKEDIQHQMEQLLRFLFMLSSDQRRAICYWRPLIVNLIALFPESWVSDDNLQLVWRFTAELLKSLDFEKAQCLLLFTHCLKETKTDEMRKKYLLRYSFDLMIDVPTAVAYLFTLTCITVIGLHLPVDRIYPFTLSLLQNIGREDDKVQHHVQVLSILSLVEQHSSITEKGKIFESLLKLTKRFGTAGLEIEDLERTLQICFDFLERPVDTGNASTFFDYCTTAKRRDVCQLICSWLSDHQTTYRDESRFNNAMRLVFVIVEKTLCFKNEWCATFFATAKRHLSRVQIPADVLEVLLSAVAGSIAVGTFDAECDDLALAVVCERARKPINPIDALSLYIEMKSMIVKAQIGLNVANEAVDAQMHKVTLMNFTIGLCHLVSLPLSLPSIKNLMQRTFNLLKSHKFTQSVEILNVMIHLFYLPEQDCSINSRKLARHLDKVLESISPSIVTQLARMPVFQEGHAIFSSLLATIVKNMPQTVTNGSSVNIFQFVTGLAPEFDSRCILPLTMAFSENCTSKEELMARFDNIKEFPRHVPPPLAPLVLACIVESYIEHMSGEREIKNLIIVLRNQRNFNPEIVVNSFLNIPKMLVRGFIGCSSKEEKENIVERIIGVAKELDSQILRGESALLFHGRQGGNEIARLLLQHDFKQLVMCTSLKPSDVTLALQLYNNTNHIDVEGLAAFSIDMIALEGDIDWNLATDETSTSDRGILTPGKLAFMVITRLKRLNVSDDELQTSTLSMCGKLINNYMTSPNCVCLLGKRETLETYIGFFISIMSSASCMEEVLHWLAFGNSHHALQCRQVILESCRWEGAHQSRDEAMSMTKKVSTTLVEMKTKLERQDQGRLPCYESVGLQLDGMASILCQIKDSEIVAKLFHLLSISAPLAIVSADIVAAWSNSEANSFLEKVENFRKESEIEPALFDEQVYRIVKLLSLAAKAYPNSATDVFKTIRRLVESQIHNPDDQQGLQMILVWRQRMISAEFSEHVIDSWCTSLLQVEDLNSRDVDAIVNLTPECIQLLSPDTNCVKKCLFSELAPNTWHSKEDHKKDGAKADKTCMKLARILNEFASITRQVATPRVVTVLRDGVKALCSRFLEGGKCSSIYKVRDDVIKRLFFLIVYEDSEVCNYENRRTGSDDKARTLTGALIHCLFTLLRRLLRSIESKPVLFSYAKDVVKAFLAFHHNNARSEEDLHRHILELEPNQDAIEHLESSEYNQTNEGSGSVQHDLWNSPFFELPACLTQLEITLKDRLTRSLRNLWSEWRDLLLQSDVNKVMVGDTEIDTRHMFGFSDTLEDMEQQASAANKEVMQIQQNLWLENRRRELLRKERIARGKFKEPEKPKAAAEKTKPTKLVIVWENRLLEIVKLCSEKIPGCYAPNGFHSEKPVICGLSVDNKILTLYKDTKGRREELEDVEVKLYRKGMLVFALHNSGHLYVTDQLWAAFFKMLLDKGLVPKIFLYNTSPAFDWIKMFVKPESKPYSTDGFCAANTLIPASEDYFDYNPNAAELLPAAHSEMKELIILTRSNVQNLQFPDLKVDNSDQIREHVQNVKAHLKEDARLLEMHGEHRDTVLRRLHFVIQKAVKLSLEGVIPTEDMIKDSLNMKMLSYECPEVDTHGRRAYIDLVLDAVKKICDGVYRKTASYNPMECVVFSQWSTE